MTGYSWRTAFVCLALGASLSACDSENPSNPSKIVVNEPPQEEETNANEAPVAVPESFTGNEDSVVTGQLSGTDADDDALTFSLATGSDVEHGTLTLQADGSFEYEPEANYNGSDQFSFVVNDGAVDSEAAVVSITVAAVNDAPTLSGMHLDTMVNTPVKATLAGVDIDGTPLTYSVVTAPTNGTTAVTASTGVVIYTPVTNYTGPDVFYVTANDGDASSAITAVTVDIKGVRRYVKTTASGAGDGTSWADAADNIQTAVNEIAAAGAGEVWVAQGTYRSPGTESVITMADHVDVYGGFAATETTLAERGMVNPALTVLTGDSDSSGTLTSGDAYHVVMGASANLEGFTLEGGNATGPLNQDRRGGGVNHERAGSLLTLSNVLIRENHAGDGGGIYIDIDAMLAIRNSRLEENTATSTAGGLSNYRGVVTIENSAFLRNSAGTSGGAIYGYGNMDVRNSVIDGNVASDKGGGIFLLRSKLTIVNSQISNNTAETSIAGAIYNYLLSDVVVTHSQLVGNRAGTDGGAISVAGLSSLSVRNSSFWNNTAASGSDVHNPPANSVFNSCAETDLSSYGTDNSTVTASPFTEAASGEYFFDPAHGCAAWGAAATATTVFSATDLDWENRTSEAAGLVMEGTTDGPAAGVLYDPLDVWIRSFDVTGSTIDWVTNASAETCSVSNDEDSNVVQVSAGDLPSGSQAHALTSGTVVTMTCLSQLSYPKAATGVVP